MIHLKTVGSQAACQVCTHLPSPTHIQTSPLATATQGIKSESKFWASSQDALPCDPAKTRQKTVFEAQQRLTIKDVSAVTDYWLSYLSS